MEIGPAPCPAFPVWRWLPAGPALIASLRKGRDDWEQLLEGVSALFLAGAEIDWRGAARGERREIVDLPTYPFQRQRHWFQAKPRPATVAVGDAAHHPTLGRALASPLPQKQFESRLSASAPTFINDHRIGGIVLLPAAAGLEMAVAAAAAIFGHGPHAIEDLVLREAMIFADDARIVQTIVDPMLNGASRFQIQSKSEHTDEWTLHYEGNLRPAAAPSSEQPEPFAEIAARCREVVPVDDLYELLNSTRRRVRPWVSRRARAEEGRLRGLELYRPHRGIGPRSPLRHPPDLAGRMPSDGADGAIPRRGSRRALSADRYAPVSGLFVARDGWTRPRCP